MADVAEPAVDGAPVGQVVTRDGTIVAANAEFNDVVGRGRQDLLGQSLESLLPAGSQIYLQTHVAPLLALQGRVDDLAMDFARPDGTTTATLASVRTDAGGYDHWAFLRAPGRARFEAEIQRGRRVAEHTKERLTMIGQLSTGLATAVDLDGVARVVAAILGIANDGRSGGVVWVPGGGEAMVPIGAGRGPSVDSPPPTRDPESPVVRAFTTGEVVVDADIEVFAVPFGPSSPPDGVVTVSLSAVRSSLLTDMLSLRDADDAGVALVADDALLLTTLAGQVGQAVHRAQLYQDKDWLLGVAAHDLRSPLTTIGGVAEVLPRLMGDRLHERERDLVESIVAAAKRMDALIEDVLVVSSSESGSLVLDRRMVDLGALARDAAAAHEQRAAAKQIDVEVVVAAADPMCSADERRLRQAVDNLVGNAVKYSDRGATVRVMLTDVDDAVRLEVIDEGQGIPADELPNVFLAFNRTSAQPTGGESSTGLGLSIVRRLVEAHGGTVDAASEVGVGSTFGFTVPRHPDPDGE